MHLGDDDKTRKLETSVIAERGAVLAKTAEKALKNFRLQIQTQCILFM